MSAADASVGTGQPGVALHDGRDSRSMSERVWAPVRKPPIMVEATAESLVAQRDVLGG